MDESILAKIRSILEKFDYDKIVNLDTDLFSAGILDSFGMVEYIVALEKEFGIKLSNDDLIPQNLWSMSATKETIKKYLK